MKKLFVWLLFLAMLAGCASFASAENNPVIEGEDPFTGLPDNGEVFTPILEVIDNNAEGFPHWGVGSASILFQIPNQSAHQTKLMALFSYAYPERAGGSRSARMTALAIANAFDAAFTSAKYGPPDGANLDKNVSVEYWLSEWGYRKAGKWYDLLGDNQFKERAHVTGIPADANCLAHIDLIHQDLIAKNVSFEKRPFLFTDEPLTRGDEAKEVYIRYFDDKGKANRPSSSIFYFDNGVSYIRGYAAKTKDPTGIDMDRETMEPLEFTNVIVLRTELAWADGYTYFRKNFVGTGAAEIFQSGRHITGSWTRDSLTSRLIILDDEGNELRFQRGKSFIIVGSDNPDRLSVSWDGE